MWSQLQREGRKGDVTSGERVWQVCGAATRAQGHRARAVMPIPAAGPCSPQEQLAGGCPVRAGARAQTDVAASSRILALITATQGGKRESDTEREPRERLQRDQEVYGGQAGPGGRGGWALPARHLPALVEVTDPRCVLLRGQAGPARRRKEPQATAGGAGAVFSSDSHPTAWHPSTTCPHSLPSPSAHPGPSLPRTPCFCSQLGGCQGPQRRGA